MKLHKKNLYEVAQAELAGYFNIYPSLSLLYFDVSGMENINFKSIVEVGAFYELKEKQ